MMLFSLILERRVRGEYLVGKSNILRFWGAAAVSRTNLYRSQLLKRNAIFRKIVTKVASSPLQVRACYAPYRQLRLDFDGRFATDLANLYLPPYLLDHFEDAHHQSQVLIPAKRQPLVEQFFYLQFDSRPKDRRAIHRLWHQTRKISGHLPRWISAGRPGAFRLYVHRLQPERSV